MRPNIKRINTSSKWVTDRFRIDFKFVGKHYEGEVVFASLLNDYEKFYLDLEKIRKSLKLSTLISFPKNPTLESLVNLEKTLGENQWEVLKEEVKNLRHRIGVTFNWQFPLEVLVLTNVLPLLPFSPFVFYDPASRISPSFIDPENSPKLILQYQFSTMQLLDWVEENRPLLKKISAQLPKNPARKNPASTLHISRLIFFYKEYENLKSQQIYDLLWKNYKSLGLKEEDVVILTNIDMDRYYKQYKKYLNSLY